MARDDIRFIYNEEVNSNISFSKFEDMVKDRKRSMGGLADDWAAARIVAQEL